MMYPVLPGPYSLDENILTLYGVPGSRLGILYSSVAVALITAEKPVAGIYKVKFVTVTKGTTGLHVTLMELFVAEAKLSAGAGGALPSALKKKTD